GFIQFGNGHIDSAVDSHTETIIGVERKIPSIALYFFGVFAAQVNIYLILLIGTANFRSEASSKGGFAIQHKSFVAPYFRIGIIYSANSEGNLCGFVQIWIQFIENKTVGTASGIDV